MPGQTLRISVDDATRYLSQVYEHDFEVSTNKILVSKDDYSNKQFVLVVIYNFYFFFQWSDLPMKDLSREPERLSSMESDDIDAKRSKDQNSLPTLLWKFEILFMKLTGQLF